MKGVSGNPKGRPHKYARVDSGDVLRFKNTTIEVTAPDGRTTIMTREGAILHRVYQSAMKGNVHAQIFLARRFTKVFEDRVALAYELKRKVAEIDAAGRRPTDYEAMILNDGLAALDLERWAKEQGLKQPVKRRRRKRKRRAKGDGSLEG